MDPLAVGADLVVWLGQFCRGQGMVLAVIDDLQWADGPSARALLFAMRRLQADRVLVVVSARPGELPRLGEGWQRFLAGDYRAGGVRLGGPGARGMWWPSAGRSRWGSCGAGPSAACWTRRAATRCTAGRCWRRPGSRALTSPVGRCVCPAQAPVAAAGPGARRSGLLGTLDLLAGRAGPGRAAAAEARLLEAWQTHDRARDAAEGAAAAFQLALLCLAAGRIPHGPDKWGMDRTPGRNRRARGRFPHRRL